MTPSGSSDGGNKHEGLAELGKLLESALARHGATARAIAERAGIGASHLSKVIKAQRTLRRAKLMILADLLGLDRDKVLRLAGFAPVARPSVDLARVTLLRALDKFTLNVVVTPRSYDTALFMWLFSRETLAEVGVETKLRRAEWGAVPAELASYTYSLGFHSETPRLFRLCRWSHLCLDKGYALVARGPRSTTRKPAAAELAELTKSKGNRLTLVTIDHSILDWLRDRTGIQEEFDVQIIANPDVALGSFQSGAGDLFLGGLAQRLVLRRGDFHELVVHGKDFPRFYMLDSLICSERLMSEKRPLLHAIDALWFDTCRRLAAEPDFRGIVFQEIIDLLERQGVEKHSLVRSDFELLFTPAGQELEIFAQTPVHLWEEERRLSERQGAGL